MGLSASGGLSRRVNNMAGFSLFVDVTPSEFAKIAQERRNLRLSLLSRTFCHVVYGRGRNASCPAPPAQIPASGTTALGSYLG
jgi:hypothetical protein